MQVRRLRFSGLRRPQLFHFHIADRGQQPANFCLVIGPFDVPLRFHLLVVLLLPIELLLPRHQPRGLRFDVGVTAFRPRVYFLALRLE